MRNPVDVFRGFCCLLGLSLAFVLPAQAQLDGGLGGELSLFEEIPSVFGASKYEQKVTEAPSSISIVTASEIRKYGYRTLAEVLNSLRGFYLTNDRTYHYAGVRGFGRPGDYNSRLLVLVDGHTMNENLYQSGFLGNELGLEVDLIDRVEVIRGPSSSLYGTSAFFGVVNVVTKRGRDLQGTEVSVSGETAREVATGRLSYGDRFANGFEMLVSGTIGDAKGDEWYYKEFDDPESNDGVAKDLDGEDFYNLYMKLSKGDWTLTGLASDRTKEYPTAPWETVFNYSPSEMTEEHYYVDLSYDHTFDNDLQLNARTYYDDYQYEGLFPYDWSEGDEPDIYVGRDTAEGNWWGAELQLSKLIAEKHLVVLGSEYRDNLKQDQYYWDDRDDAESILLDSQETSDYWAVYLQDEFQLSDNLILNAGVRHDNYSNFGGTTNPRLALIYSPTDKTSVKLLYGTAFRAPNNYEMFYHDGYYTSADNPDLDPETITSYEVVVEQYFSDNLRGVLTGFYNEIEDLISQVESETLVNEYDEPLWIFENAGEVEAWGVEAELEGKLPAGLKGRLSYTYQETEDKETGRVLSNSPEHLVKANLTIPLWNERLFCGIEEQYVSSAKTLSGGKADSYAVTNLTLFSSGLYDGLELSASVYNLFDKEYGNPGSSEHYQDTLEQEGRTFRLKLTYAF